MSENAGTSVGRAVSGTGAVVGGLGGLIAGGALGGGALSGIIAGIGAAAGPIGWAVAGVGVAVSAVSTAVGNKRDREEAMELAQIQRGDELETDRMKQDLTKEGQRITQKNIDHSSQYADKEIALNEDKASEAEGSLDRGIMDGAMTQRMTNTFGNVSAKQRRIDRQGVNKQVPSTFGRRL